MKKTRKCAVLYLGAAMYALFASFGWQAEKYGQSKPLHALLAACALFVPAVWLLRMLFARSGCAKAQEEKPFSAARAFTLILLCYTPMFLISYPGAFAYDVPFQLEQVFTGAYSSHHPLLHTLLLGGCVKLGHVLGQINLGAALYTALQMTGLAACFALTCASIARQSSLRAARRSVLFFALYPLHMMFSVNATKDVLFSGLFALALALMREALLNGRINRRLGAGIALSAAGMLMLRNNALYALLVWILLLPVFKGRRAVKMMMVSMLAIALCIGGNGLLKAATHAVDGDLCEMLSWPIQQMSRVRNLHADRLSEEDIQAVDELMPQESWRLYDPTISDPVKFEFDTEKLLSNPQKYVKAYLSMGKKCPKAYFDALVMHTYSFWYPYRAYRVSGYYLQMGVSDQYYDWCDFERISSKSLFPRVLASLTWRFGAKGAMQIPGIGYLFNMGAIVWLMLFFVLRDAYHGRWNSLAAGILPVLLWGTFLLGPVMAGRYVYPFVCCLPVLASRGRAKED